MARSRTRFHSAAEAAVALVGKRVHFAHQVGGDTHIVDGAICGQEGWMVVLDDLPGFFAPHLFVEASPFQVSHEPPPRQPR